MDAALDALIARFQADYCQLIGADKPPEHRIALAVSGGPDSMAMLGLAAKAFPGRVIAATVDHGLRPESAQESAMVARACAEIGVPHAILRIESPPATRDNVQSWARQARYSLLKRWAMDADAAVLCTAHHADDQAETFLMRAARASGLSGLAAIRARVDSEEAQKKGASATEQHRPLTILRPLLHWRRADLRTAAAAMGLPWVDDPSNNDPRFDRARFRTWLQEAPWIDPAQIGRTAENMAAVDRDVFEISRWLWQSRALEAPDRESRFDVAGLPRGVKRYIARLAIDAIVEGSGRGAGSWSYSSNIEPLLDALEAGGSATQSIVLASAKGTIWHFREAPPRRSH
ncbi:tRNA lysidine(34) synthetase TilS [Sphingomonas sp.]|uniref:tRNA lysidine(34) synthetase TilS n=1 Tax=Sphingomonas sp. TaxID=28214 RepID=UPI003B3BBFEF